MGCWKATPEPPEQQNTKHLSSGSSLLWQLSNKETAFAVNTLWGALLRKVDKCSSWLFPQYLTTRIRQIPLPFPVAATWFLGWRPLQEVRDSLYQEISVFQIGKEEGHFTFSADGQRAGQDAGTICFLNYCHLEDKDKGRPIWIYWIPQYLQSTAQKTRKACFLCTAKKPPPLWGEWWDDRPPRPCWQNRCNCWTRTSGQEYASCWMASTRYSLYVHPGIHPWATGKWHGSTHFWLEHPGLWKKGKIVPRGFFSLEKPTQTLLSVRSNHNLQTLLHILSIHFSNWDAIPHLTPLSAFRHASLTRYFLQYKTECAGPSAKLKCCIRFWNCRVQAPAGGFITTRRYMTFYTSSPSDKRADVILFFHFFFKQDFQQFLVENSFWQGLVMHEKDMRLCVNSVPIWDEKKGQAEG